MVIVIKPASEMTFVATEKDVLIELNCIIQ